MYAWRLSNHCQEDAPFLFFSPLFLSFVAFVDFFASRPPLFPQPSGA